MLVVDKAMAARQKQKAVEKFHRFACRPIKWVANSLDGSFEPRGDE